MDIKESPVAAEAGTRKRSPQKIISQKKDDPVREAKF